MRMPLSTPAKTVGCTYQPLVIPSGMPFSRTQMKAPMPWSTPASNTRAKIRCSRETPPPVIQYFSPLRM